MHALVVSDISKYFYLKLDMPCGPCLHEVSWLFLFFRSLWSRRECFPGSHCGQPFCAIKWCQNPAACTSDEALTNATRRASQYLSLRCLILYLLVYKTLSLTYCIFELCLQPTQAFFATFGAVRGNDYLPKASNSWKDSAIVIFLMPLRVLIRLDFVLNRPCSRVHHSVLPGWVT